jgi:hypothetical protein
VRGEDRGALGRGEQDRLEDPEDVRLRPVPPEQVLEIWRTEVTRSAGMLPLSRSMFELRVPEAVPVLGDVSVGVAPVGEPVVPAPPPIEASRPTIVPFISTSLLTYFSRSELWLPPIRR